MLRFVGYGPCNLRLGPSESEAASTSSQTEQTQSTTTSGTSSPVVTAAGDVSDIAFNDPTLQLATVQALANTVDAALQGAGTVAAGLNQTQQQVDEQSASEQDQQNDLLSQVLASEQQLASAEGTGGASITATSTNYLIWGAIGVALVAVFALLYGRKK